MIRPRDPDAALRRALCSQAEAAGCTIVPVDAQAVPWFSATLSGARHLLSFEAMASPALDRWMRDLPEAEWVLPGLLVADVAAMLDATRLTVAILTIDD